MLVELLRKLQPLRALPLWVRYMLAASIVMACFGLRVAIGAVSDGSQNVPIFLFFIPAVLIAPILFDRGSGYLAVALSSVLSIYFFAAPFRSFRVERAGEGWGLLSFVVIGVIAAALIEALRHAVDELSARTDALTQGSEELEATRAELEAVARQRALLLSDINHRIKNHLASVAAGLSLSKRQVEDEMAAAALDSAIRRLAVLGRVYTRLHVDGPEVVLDAKEFLQALCADLAESVIGLRRVGLKADIAHATMNAERAANLGLIVNELVTNAAKYAFPEEREGEIVVTFGETSGECVLQVRDNGVGGVPDSASTGSGTKLVKALAAQLGGSADWREDGGIVATVRLPMAC